MTKFATTNIASKDLNKLNDFNLLASQYKEMQVSLKNYVYYSILTNTVKTFILLMFCGNLGAIYIWLRHITKALMRDALAQLWVP